MTEVNDTAAAVNARSFEFKKDKAGPMRRRARKSSFWHDAEHYWHSDWLGWSWAPAPL